MKVTNSYSAQVFPKIFNCGDLYCNFGHLSSRPGQDAKKRPLWVKKRPFCKGRLKNVRGSLGYIYIYVTYRNRASFQVDFEHAFMVVCAWWDSHTCADFFFWRHFWALQKLLLLSRHGQQRRASFFSFEASYTNTWPCCIMLHVLFSAC